MNLLPSYAPTTTWEKDHYLLIWTPEKIDFGRAKVAGRVLNTSDRCVFAYRDKDAATYKLRELRGLIEPDVANGRCLPKNYKGRRGAYKKNK